MKSWRNDIASHKILSEMADKQIEVKSSEAEELPKEIKNWISKLILLKDIPLNYLVADERALPLESIRFFSMDPQWTQALVDGAYSIGSLTSMDLKRTMVSRREHHGNAKSQIRVSRYSNMHNNHKRKNSLRSGPPDASLSGFIMRSDLVAVWKGIEVKGFTGSTQVDILRMEKVSSKILLCIFEGQIDSVRMFEPKEVLHFGTRDNDKNINVRRIDDGHEGEPLYKPGTKEQVTLQIPITENGRVKVSELCSSLASALSVSPDSIQSPHIALEMLSVAGQCEFKKEG